MFSSQSCINFFEMTTINLDSDPLIKLYIYKYTVYSSYLCVSVSEGERERAEEEWEGFKRERESRRTACAGIHVYVYVYKFKSAPLEVKLNNFLDFMKDQQTNKRTNYRYYAYHRNKEIFSFRETR